MIAKGLFYFILILISGVFTIVSLILMIVKFSSKGANAKPWLIAFIIGLITLVTSVFLLTRGIINKANEFGENLSNLAEGQIEMLDSLNATYNLNEDSVLKSEQVEILMQMEADHYKNNVPSRFYTYLGFRDYYRLPLRYPFSLHCIDSLGNAELFNEANVKQFDVNDNGELACNVLNIEKFVFNKDVLMGTQRISENGKTRTQFFSFDFETQKMTSFKTEKELMDHAKTKGFKEGFSLTTCKDYYERF